MSTAMRRFVQLKRNFARMATRPLTRSQRHAISWAACLAQVAEVTEQEIALGAPHDKRQLKLTKLEVSTRLAVAGIRNPGERQQ